MEIQIGDFCKEVDFRNTMGKNKGKGAKVGGMRVIKSVADPLKVSPVPMKHKPVVVAEGADSSAPAEKLTKQQRRDRNKMAKLIIEQTQAKERGINMNLKDLQKSKKKQKTGAGAGGAGGAGGDFSAAAVAEAVTRNATEAAPGQQSATALAKRKPEMPPQCPKALLPKEKDRFMTPADESYDQVMSACYKGFVVSAPSESKPSFHHNFRKAMEGLDTDGCYQFDLTQPMGLGTRVAKTFVSRCLVGEPGCTYKYLGLRMFSYPWTEGQLGASSHTVSIGKLNAELIKKTKISLRNSGKEQYGSCEYNLTLINKCYPDGEVVQLKDEPLFKKEKCTVSWHADSTLQHYSSIAVYHCTKPVGQTDTEEKIDNEDSSWRIALRQAPNCEGPSAGKGSRDADPLAPPAVAVPLPNQSTYFLLDDFNHNNQHSVLAGKTDRYASTHRVCRVEGHTFASIKSRVQVAMQGGRGGASAKQIRIELLLQADIEFEWIRQFYIQGSAHHDSHIWWHKPMEELLGLWGSLEERIRRNIAILSDAGGTLEREKAKLDQYVASAQFADTVEHKKNRKDIRKRLERVSRVEANSFSEMQSLLADRRTKRQGWMDRERDPAFTTVPQEMRPMKPNFPISQSYTVGMTEPSDLDDFRKWQQVFVVANAAVPMQNDHY